MSGDAAAASSPDVGSARLAQARCLVAGAFSGNGELAAAVPGFSPRESQREMALAALESEALLSHPLLDFDKLLFVKRMTDTSGHIYEDPYGGNVMGGNLCILSPVAPDGKVAGALFVPLTCLGK